MSVNRNTMRRGGDYQGIQRTVVPVYDSGNGNGNDEIDLDDPVRELFLSNDSAIDNLVFQILGDSVDLTFTLLPQETIDERFLEFTKIVITASGNWRWYVRSGRIT